jgi:hypothetical protein
MSSSKEYIEMQEFTKTEHKKGIFDSLIDNMIDSQEKFQKFLEDEYSGLTEDEILKTPDEQLSPENREKKKKSSEKHVFFNVFIILIFAILISLIGLSIWGIIKLTDDTITSQCSAPADPATCSESAFIDHCEQNLEDCRKTCDSINPTSFSDDYCRYSKACLEYAGVDFDNCKLNPETPIADIDGNAVTITNLEFNIFMNKNYFIDFTPNYIRNAPKHIQTPKENFKTEPTMENIAKHNAWYVKYLGSDNRCTFISALYPQLALAHNTTTGEVSVEYLGDGSDGITSKFIFMVTPQSGRDGYYIRASNTDYYLKLVVYSVNYYWLEMAISPSSDEYLWTFNIHSSWPYQAMSKFPSMLSLNEFEVTEQRIQVTTCQNNYLYITSDTQGVYSAYDEYNQCFDVIDIFTSNLDEPEAHMILYQTAFEANDKGRSISDKLNESTLGSRVMKINDPDPKNLDQAVYVRFMLNKTFVIGSTYNDTFIGLENNSCSIKDQDLVPMIWSSFENAIVFKFTSGCNQ